MKVFFAFLLGVGLARAESSQLPQLVNVDGSLSGAVQSTASSAVQGVQNGLAQAGQTLGQAHQHIAQGAENLYNQGHNLLNQSFNEMKNAANQFGDKVQQVGSQIAQGPRTFMNGLGQMNNQLQNSIDGAIRTASDKLKDLQQSVGEKFSPLVQKAEQIFGQPGTEREKWNELVGQVESANLTEAEKQELYQKIANATAPQIQPQNQPEPSQLPQSTVSVQP